LSHCPQQVVLSQVIFWFVEVILFDIGIHFWQLKTNSLLQMAAIHAIYLDEKQSLENN